MDHAVINIFDKRGYSKTRSGYLRFAPLAAGSHFWRGGGAELLWVMLARRRPVCCKYLYYSRIGWLLGCVVRREWPVRGQGARAEGVNHM